MVKSEIITNITCKTRNILPKVVEGAVHTIIEQLSSALCAGSRIEIRGFGSFSLHVRGPRNAHNPKTGRKVVTQAKSTPHFKPGKELRQRVNAGLGTVPIKK